LLYRYASTGTGKPTMKAEVYTLEEHRIDRNLIDPDALRIINRLKANGHEAYLVGGAVRDLLLGKEPKDFDIATDALPGRIHRLFWNSRIIGKRFRLVHISFGEKIFEVATFRSLKDGTSGNTYGTIDEDVLRRDFSFNALYYDPRDQVVVDYVHGLRDIKAKKVKPVIPLKVIFIDDPVRMIRAVKYASTTGFTIPFMTRHTIRKHARLLGETSSSRRTEELLKILNTGSAESIIRSLRSYKLFAHLLPEADSAMDRNPAWEKKLFRSLGALDALSATESDARMGKKLSFLLRDYLETALDRKSDPLDLYKEALTLVRNFLNPMNPPRVEVEHAVRLVFRELGLPLIKKSATLMPGKGAPAGKKGGAAPQGPKPTAEGETTRRRRRRRHGKKPAAAEGLKGEGLSGPVTD
jgi:poly(A) polymerase